MIATSAFPGKLAFGPIPRGPEDVRAVVGWGADLMVSLVTTADMARRDVSALPNWIKDAGLNWLHLPIEDYHAPDSAFDAAWRRGHGEKILDLLRSGGKVFVHCAGGLGRSGTIVARILIEAGVSVDDAVAMTRKTRPGAIETPDQEAYLKNL